MAIDYSIMIQALRMDVQKLRQDLDALAGSAFQTCQLIMKGNQQAFQAMHTRLLELEKINGLVRELEVADYGDSNSPGDQGDTSKAGEVAGLPAGSGNSGLTDSVDYLDKK